MTTVVSEVQVTYVRQHFLIRFDCASLYSWSLATMLIPAKKWGDTEIAERGRSVLVMRARYKSAGLIPHQRGWMDAG